MLSSRRNACTTNKFGKTKFKDRRIKKEEVIQAVTEFIPYYNNERLKESLGWMSPEEFLKSNPKGTELMVL